MFKTERLVMKMKIEYRPIGVIHRRSGVFTLITENIDQKIGRAVLRASDR